MVGMVTVRRGSSPGSAPRTLTVAGLATLAAGLAWLSFIHADGNFWFDVLPASLITAAGMAMAFIPSLGLALPWAAPQEAGLAAASSTPTTRSAPPSAWQR